MNLGIEDRPRDLLIAGHVNVDRFLRVDEFPGPDRTVPVVADRVELGGTAALIALSAARRRLAVGIVARVGADFPPRFRAKLRAAGIDLRGLETVAGTGTPTCYIVENGRGGQRTLIDQGPMGDGRVAKRPGRWLREYSWIHLGTGDSRLQLRLAVQARAAGVHVAVDPAQEIFYRWTSAAFRKLISGAELLFGNTAEIERAARLVGARDAGALVDRVPLVVRTEGRDGVTAFSRSRTIHSPAGHPRQIRTEVGAGDAFRGGFYGGWFGGLPLRECLRAGTRAALERIEKGA